MKYIFFEFILLVFTVNIFAQIDTTRKEFYPLHIGDIWQYRNADNQLGTMKVTGDTLIDGYLYYKIVGGGLRTSGNGTIRIDSLMEVEIYGGSADSGVCINYKLAEKDSSIWKACYNFNGIPTSNQLVRFNNIFISNVFGQQREVMQFNFGGIPPDEDTIWNYGASLARGIGIIEEQYFDGEFRILQGAVINGIQYGTIVSIDRTIETIPKDIVLYQNYPNPFNPSTKIRYEISERTVIKLFVINILGQQIATLVNEEKKPGSYEVNFNGANLSSGVYMAVLQSNERRLARRMLLIK